MDMDLSGLDSFKTHITEKYNESFYGDKNGRINMKRFYYKVIENLVDETYRFNDVYINNYLFSNIYSNFDFLLIKPNDQLFEKELIKQYEKIIADMKENYCKDNEDHIYKEIYETIDLVDTYFYDEIRTALYTLICRYLKPSHLRDFKTNCFTIYDLKDVYDKARLCEQNYDVKGIMKLIKISL
jgi:hypothetical protein